MCSRNTFHYCLCPLIRKKAIWSGGHNCFHWSCCLECPAQCLRVEITVADSTLSLFFFTELDQECWSECLNARPFKNIFPFSFQLRMETQHSSCQWDTNQSLWGYLGKLCFPDILTSYLPFSASSSPKCRLDAGTMEAMVCLWEKAMLKKKKKRSQENHRDFNLESLGPLNQCHQNSTFKLFFFLRSNFLLHEKTACQSV